VDGRDLLGHATSVVGAVILSKGKIRVVSNGTPQGTIVLGPDGQRLKTGRSVITKILVVAQVDQPVQAVIYVDNVELDVIADEVDPA
jgi:hypothetical protein